MKKLTKIVAAALALVSLASCCNKISLDGQWDVKTVGGETVEASEEAPYIVFNEAEGTVHGFLGVNLINGNYTLKGEDLAFEHLGTTMMSGLPQDMDLEAKLLDAINAAAVAEVQAEKLVISDSEGKELLTLVRN